MNISTRLMLGLGFVVVLLLVLGTTGQVALASLGRAVDALMRADYTVVQAAGEMARAADQQDASAFAVVLGDTTGYAAKREAAAQEQYRSSREAAGKGVDGTNSELLARVDDAKRRFDESLQRLRSAPRGPDAVNFYYATLENDHARLTDAIGALSREAQARGSDTGSDALRVAWRTRAWAGVITASVFAALIWTVTHLYRTIVWPLGEMARTARALGRGEMNRRFRVGEKDELGELASLLNSLADRLFSKEREAAQRDVAHEQLLESVLDTWHEGLGVVDQGGRVLGANEPFRALLLGMERRGKSELFLDKMLDIERHTLVFRGKRELGELVRMLPPRGTVPDVKQP